jgi:predicted ATPase
MEPPNWYVLTGGPSSGKTTLLERLQKLGFQTVPEAARALIEECRAKGISAKELRKDELAFQERVLQMKLEIEDKTTRDKVVFFDRGIPDSIAYYKVLGVTTNGLEEVSKNRYKKIFFLEQLPFQEDGARIENKETVKKLNQSLLECYENLGYEIIFLPAVSVEERLEIILSNL